MDYKGFWMYYRAVIVSIIASIADMSSMYGLNKVENLSEPIVLGVSSLIGLFIQFFGQKYWTFKNNTKSNNELIKLAFRAHLINLWNMKSTKTYIPNF